MAENERYFLGIDRGRTMGFLSGFQKYACNLTILASNAEISLF
jgi:hypothetical protein